MKLFQALEQIFKLRILSNAEIPQYIRKVSAIGRFDEPKKIAVLSELLQRVAALEDRQEKLVLPTDEVYKDSFMSSQMISVEPVIKASTQPTELSWKEMQKKGRELGIYKVGMKKDELQALLASKL